MDSLVFNFFIFPIVLIYIIIVSYYSNKFHSALDQIKKNNIRLKLNKIEPSLWLQNDQVARERIAKTKSASYRFILLFGALHFSCIFFGVESYIRMIAVFLLFVFVLAGIYWLKGAATLSAIPKQGVTDWEFH